MNKKILIAGCNGLLGQNLLFSQPDHTNIIGIDIQEKGITLESNQYFKIDLTDRDLAWKLIKELSPDVIINAAAFTNVDAAETDKETCWKINVDLVSNLAYCARKLKAKLVHISTDYIFDGKNGPYDEDARPNPLGYYGRSKLASENELLGSTIDFAILRTMVLYGRTLNTRPNFVDWLVGQLKAGNSVRIVNDQYGNTTLAEELAIAVWNVIQTGYSGILHAAGSEIVNRYEFAQKIAELYKLDASLIHSISTAELGQAAPRPLNSGLIVKRAESELNMKFSDVITGLKKYMAY